MAYENKPCWRRKHSNTNVGHDCCVLLFSADSPLRITVPELAHFTKLPCELLCPPPLSYSCVKKRTAHLQLQFLLCLPTKRSQGDSDYTKQCLTLTRYSGHDAFCRRTTEKNDTTLSEPSCDSGNGARGGNVNMPSRYSCRKTNIAKYWTSSPT